MKVFHLFHLKTAYGQSSVLFVKNSWVLLGMVIVGFSMVTAVQSAESRRIAEPLVQPAFTPLRPGAIEPEGWLRDWALAARKGITGHLDEWSPVYRDGWKGIRIEEPGLSPDGTGWPLEQCSYWLDGLIRLGYLLHDDALIRKATDRLHLVVDGVNRGGNSFIYWKKDPPRGFDSWACSHMGRALVAWYDATGDQRILDALVRVYSHYPLPREEIKFDDISGLCNLDPMLETYSFSGEKKVFNRVLAAAHSPGVDATFRAWEDRRYDPGHAVCTYEKLRLPLLLFPWTGAQRYRAASLRAFAWVNEHHLLPYGVASGMENLAGIGAFRLTETCAVVAQLYSSVWFYRIEGDRSYGDDIERAFFNAGAAPIARDFQTMCYYQSPNRIESETLPAEQPKSPGKGCLKFTRLAYPRVLCCVGAVNRLIPNYILHMWMSTADHGLAATLYGPCTVSASVGGSIPLKLTCQTAYPFEETVRIAVDPGQAATFPLYFRIPSWCGGGRITVNGSSQDATPDAKGFVRLERKWNQGDAVKLFFPMTVQIARGYETEYPPYYRKYFDFKPDQVFQKRRFPYESVVYGPLLFALPIADQDPNTRTADARWQFALDIDVKRGSAEAEVTRQSMPPKWDWPLNAPIAIKMPAKAFDWKPSDIQPLPAEPVKGSSTETIRLVPYGCTKFRISMFPVTQKAWGKPSRESSP
jgi:hypothetical protein